MMPPAIVPMIIAGTPPTTHTSIPKKGTLPRSVNNSFRFITNSTLKIPIMRRMTYRGDIHAAVFAPITIPTRGKFGGVSEIEITGVSMVVAGISVIAESYLSVKPFQHGVAPHPKN